MTIFTRLLQKYYPTQKLCIWALALLYMSPVSLLGAQQSTEEIDGLIDKIEVRKYQNTVKKSVEDDKKASLFISRAFEKIKAQNSDEKQKEKAWLFLYHVCRGSNLQNLTEELEPLTPEICVAIKKNEVQMKALYAVEEILTENKEVAKRFAIQAFAALAKLDKSSSESIENMWKFISFLESDDIQADSAQLEKLNYQQLDPLWKERERERGIDLLSSGKLLLQDYLGKNKEVTIALAKKAFEGDNQKAPHFWDLLAFLTSYQYEVIDEKDHKFSRIDATEIDIKGITLETAFKGAKEKPHTLIYVLIQDKNEKVIEELWKKALKSDVRESYKFLSLIQGYYGKKLDSNGLTAEKVIEMWNIDKAKVVCKKILRQNKAKAKDIANEIFNRDDLKGWKALDWLIGSSGLVKPEEIEVKKFDVETVPEKFAENQNKKSLMRKLLKSHPEAAKELVEDILKSEDELNLNKVRLLYWLVLSSNENNKGAIVPSEKININKDYAFKIFEKLAEKGPRLNTTYRMLDILKSIIKAKPQLGKQLLQIAVNGNKGNKFLKKDVDFGVLYLLMVHENGPQLAIEKENIGTLDLSVIKQHLETEKALPVIEKILDDNESVSDSLCWEIFAPKNPSMRDTPFNCENVDWDKTKWKDIKGLERFIKSIEIPADIVVRKLEDENFRDILKVVFENYNDKQQESILKKAFPNITITNGGWNQSLSQVNWDVVKLFVESGLITPKDVIDEVLPDIKSEDEEFKKNYNLASVKWEKFNEEAFQNLVKHDIAKFSDKNYQTIAENLLPGIKFVKKEVRASNIDWKKVINYKTIDFLLKKNIIPKNILINMPYLLLRKRIKNASLDSPEAGFWEEVKKQKLAYYWSFAPQALMLIVLSIIIIYVFYKKGDIEEEDVTQNKRRTRRKRQSKKIQNK